MRRFLVELEFCGKNYCGWQKQPKVKTIQGEVETALKELFKASVEAVGCSRTDSGVSAKKYYFQFDADSKLPESRIAYKLNRFLPKDIQCQDSREVAPDFAIKQDVRAKTYVYRFYDGEHVRPLVNRDAYYVKCSSLDLLKMNAACRKFIGKKNFSAFKTESDSRSSSEKTIFSAKVVRGDDNVFSFAVTGDGFLYNMVRIMAGTIIAVGSGEIKPDDVDAIISSNDRQTAGMTLPAKALILDNVEFVD